MALTETVTDSVPAIAVEDLRKTFESEDGTVTAIDGVSFTIEPGSVVGLLGPNGAGKTTTTKSILGLVRPDSGTVRIDGTDISEHPRKALDRVDAMLEGARNDYWRLTPRENLRYFATVGGDDPKAVARRHEELLETFDLAEKADEPVRDLSRGMKQKVSLASVLSADVSVVFLDEPTLGLDVESSATLRQELNRIVDDRGLTVVISSHDMDVVEDVCDRVIIMNDGRIIVDDDVENLLEQFETQEYRLEVGGADREVVERLRDRYGVSDVARFDRRVQFRLTADSATFYRLMDELRSAGVTLNSVDTVQPELEDIFLEVTSEES
ncbi:ABC transporter ATP-binding protein [Halopelagius longus]|uniref:ABC transporter ATP-binding protein n=1 Tax=Halopelagius longus TaxID=1236180 RepID=A0A1H1G5F4_9EURY|nr:ABC transporter ATP-binding protein [Halopelagius longus]RDI69839.1 ABC transporter ATP-binding protein [Halopelagius longus]SDR08309.1 ABC-2 type transport system ATP-binding protein [Halopelagius longus]